MTLTLILGQDLCLCCNFCIDTLLSVCRTGENELAEVFDSNGANPEPFQQVIDDCPVACIRWEP